MKNSRYAGFVIILIGYMLAALAGGAVFLYIGGSVILRAFAADIAATLVIYVLSLIFGNASFYDPYWSVQPPVILVALAAYCGVRPEMLPLIAVVAFWSVRLTANWAYTFKSLSVQDWRYDMLRQKSGRLFFLVDLFGIQLFPTCVVFCCIMPAIRFIELGGGFNALSGLFLALSLLAAVLQLVSDVQMQRFRLQKNRGIMRTGLWRCSRHPNYLGEILMWWGVYGACVCVFPQLWPLFFGALANTLMFVFISIPMAEKRLAGYKPGFEEHCRQTRMLLPLPRAHS